MDILGAQAKQALRYEGIREVNHNIGGGQALEKVKNDGLKEVFFKAGDKEYVAYGKDLDVDAFKSTISTKMNGKEITVDFVDDEATGILEGAKKAITSTGGAVAESLGLAGGAVLGAISGIDIWSSSSKIGPSSIKGAVIVGAITTAIVGGYGAIKAGTKDADYAALKEISKEIK